MQLKGAPRRHLQAAHGKGAGPETSVLDQALLHWRKINGLHQVEVAAPEGEVGASLVTNVAFWSLLLSSLCYFSLLQICLDSEPQPGQLLRGEAWRWEPGNHLGDLGAEEDSQLSGLRGLLSVSSCNLFPFHSTKLVLNANPGQRLSECSGEIPHFASKRGSCLYRLRISGRAGCGIQTF